MSDQIREQVSAFLDGELPSSETELLLKRLTRDAELRQSFGRYAVIGETLRGGSYASLSLTFAARVNRAIDGEPAAPGLPTPRAQPMRWWRPIAGTAVAAGVAAVAVVALQQRAVEPGVRGPSPVAAQTAHLVVQPKEAISYTVPVAARAEPAAMVPAARLTSYVFAHSKYSVGLGQGNLLSTLLSEDQVPAGVDAGQGAAAAQAAAGAAARPAEPVPARDSQTAP
jgi:sigma-E factor negative regulatory protein RseA